MSRLDTLTDVFAELEHEVDELTARASFRPAPPARSARLRPRVLMAASAVVVLVVVTAAVLVTRRDHPGAPAAGSRSAAPSSTVEVPSPSLSPSSSFTLPTPGADLVARFHRVLGAGVSFTARDAGPGAIAFPLPLPPHTGPGVTRLPSKGVPSGAAMTGVITNASGVQGGYSLSVAASSPHLGAVECGDCVQRTLPDGSLLITRDDALSVPGGVDLSADLLRSDGVELILHVSNESDPKGPAGARLLGRRPPFTVAQLATIVTSPQW